MTAERSTRWARGLFRLWLVISVIWLILTSLLLQPWDAWSDLAESNERITNAESALLRVDEGISEGRLELEDGTVRPLEELESDRPRIEAILRASTELASRRENELVFAAGATLLPPTIVLIIGVMLGWAIRGFRA